MQFYYCVSCYEYSYSSTNMQLQGFSAVNCLNFFNSGCWNATHSVGVATP